MRQFAVVALLGLVGCVGDDSATTSEDSGAPPFVSEDGGAPPVAEAGPTDATLSDAPSVDAPAPVVEASVDAPEDTTPPPVTITALDGNTGLPEPGVTVVFGDATGAIVGTATTGVTGTASMLLAAGGMVTVGFGNPTHPGFVTIMGVEPGDALTAVDRSVVVAQSVEVESIPPLPDGGVHYELMAAGFSTGSSSFTSAPQPMTIAPVSQIGGTTSILLSAEDSDYEPLPYYTALKGTPLLLDGGTTDVTFPGPFTNASITQTIVAENYPATSNGWFVMNEIAANLPFLTGQNVDFSTPDGGSVSAGMTVRTALADEMQSEATVATYLETAGTSTAIATRGAVPADGGTTMYDLSTLLPLLTFGTLDATDPQRPVVAWGTDAGSLGAADGVYVAMEWYTTDYQQGVWSFVVPPTASQIQAPMLPAALAAWLPEPDGGATSWIAQPEIGVVEATFVASYAELRSTFADFPTSSIYLINGSPTIPALPVDGTLRLTEVTGNAD